MQDGIIPDLHPNKQMKAVMLGMLEPCTGKEYTGLYDQINKQRHKLNQFLINKTNYQVHALTETEQSLSYYHKTHKTMNIKSIILWTDMLRGKSQ